MNAKTQPNHKPSADQTSVELLLEDIATNANSLRDMLTDMQCAITECTPNSLAIARTVVERMGWLADLGIKQISGSTSVVGDAEEWMLGRAARDAVKGKGA